MENNTVAVIPSYNEDKTINKVIEETLKHVSSVVLVDDGSKDKTEDVLENEYQGRLYYLRHPINMGKGAALRTGVRFAAKLGATRVVLLDADGQHNPQEIPRFLAKLNEGTELAIGARKKDGNMPFSMRSGNLFLSRLIQLLFGSHVEDTQSGYRAFEITNASKLIWKSNDYFVETEMLIRAEKNKLKVRELPIATIYHDSYKGTTFIDGIKIFFNIIKLRVYD